MKQWHWLKNRVGEYMLERQLRSQGERQVRTKNLQHVNTLGLVFSMTDEVAYRMACDFAHSLKEEGIKEVHVLGFSKEKTLPAYAHPKYGIDFVLRKDLNWWHRPQCLSADQFIAQPFDLLLDFGQSGDFPLEYVVAHAHANLKVGKFEPRKQRYLDMMINADEEEGMEALMKHTYHYLNIINQPA